MASGELLGKVTHYYDKIHVAVIRLDRKLQVGESVHILGRNTDFEQTVASMQVEHQPIKEAAPGAEVAVKVDQPVRSGDSIYRLSS
jgi:translation elongation factor EF-1alpha